MHDSASGRDARCRSRVGGGFRRGVPSRRSAGCSLSASRPTDDDCAQRGAPPSAKAMHTLVGPRDQASRQRHQQPTRPAAGKRGNSGLTAMPNSSVPCFHPRSAAAASAFHRRGIGGERFEGLKHAGAAMRLKKRRRRTTAQRHQMNPFTYVDTAGTPDFALSCPCAGGDVGAMANENQPRGDDAERVIVHARGRTGRHAQQPHGDSASDAASDAIDT